jgi:MFS family permease
MGSSLGRAAAFAGGGLVFAWFATRRGLDLPGFAHFEPWQAVFLTAGAVGIVYTVIFLVTVREPARIGRAAERASLASGFAHFWRHVWAYLAIFVPFGMTTAIAALLAGWSVSFYVRSHGLDVATAGSLIGITGLIFGPIGHLLGGWINDHLRSRGISGAQPYVLAVSLLSSASLAVLFALTSSLVLAASAYAVAYVMLCIAGPTGFGGVQLPTPDNKRGVMASIFLLIYNAIGTAIGPLLVGLIGDRFFPDPHQLGWAIAVSLAVLVGCGLPFAFLGRPAYRRAVLAQEASLSAIPG